MSGKVAKIVESAADRSLAHIQQRLADHGALAHLPTSTFKSIFYGPYKNDNYYCVIVSNKSGDHWRGMRCFNMAMEAMYPQWWKITALPSSERPDFHPIFDGLAWFGNELEERNHDRVLTAETIVLFQRLLQVESPTKADIEATLKRSVMLAELDELGVKDKLQLGRLDENIEFITDQVHQGVPVSMLLALYKPVDTDVI